MLTICFFFNMYYARYCLICSLSNYCDPLKLNCKKACQRINPSQVYYLPRCFQNRFLSYTCTLCFDVFFCFIDSSDLKNLNPSRPWKTLFMCNFYLKMVLIKIFVITNKALCDLSNFLDWLGSPGNYWIYFGFIMHQPCFRVRYRVSERLCKKHFEQ